MTVQISYDVSRSARFDEFLSDSCVSVIEINAASGLLNYRRQLEELSFAAVEPNIFYEPWMLFPALQYYAGEQELVFLLVFIKLTAAQGVREKILCGFFPLQKRSYYRGLPVPGLTLWRYPYCFLSTPLVHKQYLYVVYRVFFEWARGKQSFGVLLELPQLSVDGLSDEILLSNVSGRPKLRFTVNRFERSFFRPRQTAEKYLEECLSTKAMGELRRQYRRLSELGHLECEQLQKGEDLGRWTNEFMQLEASGWKGRSGTAFESKKQDRDFFLTITRNAFNQGRLMMLALRLDRHPVAMKCNFLAADGGFAFKIAFDENFRRFSPGVLLEMENIRRLHNDSNITWMDSCAAPDHFMINRLWLDRKSMRTILLSANPVVGTVIIRLVDMLKRVKSFHMSRRTRPGNT